MGCANPGKFTPGQGKSAFRSVQGAEPAVQHDGFLGQSRRPLGGLGVDPPLLFLENLVQARQGQRLMTIQPASPKRDGQDRRAEERRPKGQARKTEVVFTQRQLAHAGQGLRRLIAMDDAGGPGADLEVVERALAPAEEPVSLIVAGALLDLDWA